MEIDNIYDRAGGTTNIRLTLYSETGGMRFRLIYRVGTEDWVVDQLDEARMSAQLDDYEVSLIADQVNKNVDNFSTVP